MRQWVKLHTILVNDPKMLAMNDSLFRVSINLIAVGGLVDKQGRLGTPVELRYYLRMPVSKVNAALEKLEQVCFLECRNGVWFLKNWSKFNEKAPSDAPEKVRERVAKYRKNKVNDAPVTTLQGRYKRDGNADVTRQNRIEENRIEENRKDSTGANPAPETDPVKELASVFEQASGIKLDSIPKKQQGPLFWNPLRLMNQSANGSAPVILQDAISHMRKDGLTISSPNSCLKVFTSLNGERASGKSKKAQPMTPEQVSEMNRKLNPNWKGFKAAE